MIYRISSIYHSFNFRASMGIAILFILSMHISYGQSVFILTDTSIMQIGEQRPLDIEIHTPLDISPEKLGIENIIDSITYYGFDSSIIKGTDNFEVLSENGWQKNPGINDEYVYSKSYLYTVWKDGLYLIPGPSPTIIRVGTVIDTSYQGLAPMKDIITTNFDFGAILKKIAAFMLLKLLIILALIYLGVSYLSNDKKARVDLFTIPLKLYINHEANRFSEHSIQKKTKTFYSKYTSLLRLVLEKHLNIPVKGYTTSMIAEVLNVAPTPQNMRIVDFLHHADYIKYAQGNIGAAQISDDYNSITEVVKTLTAEAYEYKISGAKLKLMDPQLYEYKRIAQFNFAEWMPRLFAGLFDFALIVTMLIIVVLPFGFFEYVPYLLSKYIFSCMGIAILVYLILNSFYKTAGHTKAGQTFGKHLSNIEVVNIHHDFPSITTSFLRSLLSIPSLWLIGLGYYTVFSLPRKQAIHDLILKIFVVTK